MNEVAQREKLFRLLSALVKASESWHGVKMTPEILRQLDALRGQPVKEREKELVAA